MEHSLFNRILLAGAFVFVGFVIISLFTIFWKQYKAFSDSWGRIGYGEKWTGKYGAGAELFIRGIGILFGSLFLIAGIVSLLRSVD
ncbi:MAG TPA: hypothetical protein VF723_18035 [Pyrinomonadaceae bacterium]|jgi:hypothetical protein